MFVIYSSNNPLNENGLIDPQRKGFIYNDRASAVKNMHKFFTMVEHRAAYLNIREIKLVK